jgi:hypothetical protein
MTGWLNTLYGEPVPQKPITERRKVLESAVAGKFDRVKYQREYMRRRRAKLKKAH